MADCEKAAASNGAEIQSASKGTPKPSPSKSAGTKLTYLDNFKDKNNSNILIKYNKIYELIDTQRAFSNINVCT